MPNENQQQQQMQPQRRRKATLRQMPVKQQNDADKASQGKQSDGSHIDSGMKVEKNVSAETDNAQHQQVSQSDTVLDNQKHQTSTTDARKGEESTTTKQQVQQPSSDEETEYEYVSFGELISPFIDKLRFWVNELNVFFVCLLVLLICVVIVIIGNMTSVVFIIGALAILAVLFAIILYSFWQNRKKAYEDLRRAEILYAESQKIISEHVGDDSKDDNKKNKNNSK